MEVIVMFVTWCISSHQKMVHYAHKGSWSATILRQASWTAETRQDGAMLSWCLHQILSKPHECGSRNGDLSDQVVLLLPNVDESALLPQVAALSWQEWHLVCPPAEPIIFKVVAWSEMLFCRPRLEPVFLLLFFHLQPVWPFTSDLWHQQRIPAHWVFFFLFCFGTILLRMCENLSRSAPKSPFILFLMLFLNLKKDISTNMPQHWVAAMWLED